MSLQRCKVETTSTEFKKWMYYLASEEKRDTKGDVALARIAAEVRRSYAKNPQAVKEESFIVRFQKPKKVDVTDPAHIERIKAAWAARIGVFNK